jgi:hypothetical protein
MFSREPNFMKSFFVALMLLCLPYGSDLSATPLFVHNHGYVLGELTGVTFVGLNRRVVTGEVSIGNSGFGGTGQFHGQLNSDYILNNPWNFCSDQAAYENLVNYIGEYVVIEYKTPKASSLLSCPATNEFVAIYPLSRNQPSSRARESTKINVADKPYGVSVGRIVNAQKSDKYDKNWSVVVQVGNSGSDFSYLQIVDEDLYEFALDCLGSGTRVKVYHIEQFHSGRNPDRSYSYAWRIEAKPGL